MAARCTKPAPENETINTKPAAQPDHLCFAFRSSITCHRSVSIFFTFSIFYYVSIISLPGSSSQVLGILHSGRLSLWFCSVCSVSLPCSWWRCIVSFSMAASHCSCLVLSIGRLLSAYFYVK